MYSRVDYAHTIPMCLAYTRRSGVVPQPHPAHPTSLQIVRPSHVIVGIVTHHPWIPPRYPDATSADSAPIRAIMIALPSLLVGTHSLPPYVVSSCLPSPSFMTDYLTTMPIWVQRPIVGQDKNSPLEEG